MTSFQIILLCVFTLQSNGLLQKPSLIKKTTDFAYLGEEWDCGEVSWFNNDNEYIENNYFDNAIALNNSKQNQRTPLNDIVKSDQLIMASTSAVIKTSYKQLFTFDVFISEFNNNMLNSKLSKILTPSELFILTILSGLFVVYNKTKEVEIIRLNSLYKYDEKTEYFQTYTQVRKIVMMVFILLSCIFTRNVQIVL